MVARPVVDGLPGRVYSLDIHEAEGRRWWERLDGRLTPTFVVFDGRGEVAYRTDGRAPDPARAGPLLR